MYKTAKINYKLLILNIFIPLAVGGLSSLLTMGGMEEYKSISKPPLAPPGTLFPIVWSILFILMGISAYLIVTSQASKTEKQTALSVYAVQLFFVFWWTIIFFNLGAYLFAFAWLAVLWILIAFMIYSFLKISKTAGLLQIPYFLWVAFAGYLNLSVYFLNK